MTGRWMCPLGTETALARIIGVWCGEATLPLSLGNRRANRMKVLVHDGVGFRFLQPIG